MMMLMVLKYETGRAL